MYSITFTFSKSFFKICRAFFFFPTTDISTFLIDFLNLFNDSFFYESRTRLRFECQLSLYTRAIDKIPSWCTT